MRYDDLTPTAALRSFTISSSIASPASTSSSSVMRGMPLRRDAPPRASSGTWMNAARRKWSSCADRLDRAPAQIVAEIAAGIARGPRVDAGAECRAQEQRYADRTCMASCPRPIDPLRTRVWSASGQSVVMALRARVSIRRWAVRPARPNISSAWGRCLPAAVAIRGRPLYRSRERCDRTVRHRQRPDGAAAAAAPPAACVGL